LAAHVVSTRTPAELAAELAATLPAHLVPALWSVLDAFPLTASGKLDRARLPEPLPPGLSRPTTTDASEAAGTIGTADTTSQNNPAGLTPTKPPDTAGTFGTTAADEAGDGPSDVERAVRGLWADELGTTEALRADAEFFAVGGHSLSAIRLLTRVREEFGVEYPVLEFFQAPTIRAMTARLALGATHPLSYFQQRMWTRHQEHPDPSVYNVRRELELRGPLDPAALRRALDALVARHEALRTRFVRRDGAVVAEVAPPAPVPHADAGAVDAAFDLTGTPLVRYHLTRHAADRWTFVLVVHHLACDHTTLTVLLEELAELYAGRVPRGTPTSFAEHARAERRALEDPATRERLLAHWRATLDGARLRPALPTDRPRRADGRRSGHGAEHRFTVDGAVVRGLDALARAHGTTRYVVLCSAFARLLRELTGDDDVVVITSTTTRGRGHERTVGVFTDALPLRIDASGEFGDVVDRTGRALFTALDHRPMPLWLIVESLGDTGFPAVPTVLFTVLDDEGTAPVFGGARATAVDGPPATVARMELYVTLLAREGGLEGAVEYATDLFDAATVRRWCDVLTGLLAAAGAPGRTPLPDRSGISR
ncbi:MAG TPA: condensation domain-containing protein, partial [Pseudonocardiaceae bacterium]